jgi:hypothetical protein
MPAAPRRVLARVVDGVAADALAEVLSVLARGRRRRRVVVVVERAAEPAVTGRRGRRGAHVFV